MGKTPVQKIKLTTLYLNYNQTAEILQQMINQRRLKFFLLVLTNH